MASSLDELQPNDYFQITLEELLNKYTKLQKPDLTELFILNHFIEFICFRKNLDRFEQINQYVIKEFHVSILLLLPEQKKEEINQTLTEYFLFISKTGKYVPEFLINT